MTLLSTACYYVHQLKWSVIPCQYKGKGPLTSWKRYQERTPTDEELVTWFHRQDRNIAIVTGDISQGLLVLDFDRKDLFRYWQEKNQIYSLMVSTGKGIHVYFYTHHNPRNGKFYVNGNHAGEIRFNGGYVLAPPSKHPNGFTYAWIPYPDITTISLHDLGIIQKISPQNYVRHSPPVKPGKRQGNVEGIPSYVKNPVAYCQSALNRELDKVYHSEEGKRNDTLFTAALKLKKYESVLGPEIIFSSLREAGCQVGLPKDEVNRTLQSAFSY